MWTRSGIKTDGKERLKKNYWKSVLAAFVMTILSGSMMTQFQYEMPNSYYHDQMWENGYGNYGSSRMMEAFSSIGTAGMIAAVMAIVMVTMIVLLVAIGVAILIDTFLLNPIRIGVTRFFLVNQHENAKIREIAFGYDNQYKNIVGVMFFKNLKIFLWTLLLIIPGIIKSYELRMVDYFLTENPQIDRQTAFAMSKEMMMGEKWNAFVLDLSFVGWYILSLFTFGLLAILYVSPYHYQTNAQLYLALKNKQKDSSTTVSNY